MHKKVGGVVHTHHTHISSEIILGYAWCRDREFNIHPKQHGMVCFKHGRQVWVEGLRMNTEQPPMAPQIIIAHSHGLFTSNAPSIAFALLPPLY